MNPFQNWNKRDVERFNKLTDGSNPGRTPAATPGGAASSAVAECVVRNDANGAAPGKAGDAGRVLVRVTSYRCTLLDPDNFCPKFFIDCCRYAGFLREDTLAEIKLEEEQVRVESAAEECTVIEIYPKSEI